MTDSLKPEIFSLGVAKKKIYIQISNAKLVEKFLLNLLTIKKPILVKVEVLRRETVTNCFQRIMQHSRQNMSKRIFLRKMSDEICQWGVK